MRCPQCDVENPAGMKFCGQCGSPLAGETPLIGELKQVTVLFCDIVNSTRLAERLGPEAMHELVRSFIDLALDEVHRYGGTAPQFLGDGFMALFGAPVTHEDHVRRSLLAALAIRGTVGASGERAAAGDRPDFAVRIGIHTGLVVFGSVGARLRMDPTAIGDAANIAARLQGAAEPGTIVISEATERLARGYARVEPVGPFTLKGKAEPIAAYRLLGYSDRRTALDAAAASGVRDFVDRDSELAALIGHVAEIKDGLGRVVGLMGEPGIGKSRLLAEFRRCIGDMNWVEGRCLSYGTATPYLLVLDLLRSNCGISEADTPEAITQKVRFGLQQVGMDPDEDGPHLLHLFGLLDVGGARRHCEPRCSQEQDLRHPASAQPQHQPAPAPCVRARGPAVDRQGIGGIPHLVGRGSSQGTNPGYCDLPPGVSSTVAGQALFRPDPDAAVVARRQSQRRSLGPR